MQKHTVLVYGTLRPFLNTAIAHVPGYLYDLGWYPGVQLADPAVTDSHVVCERITVDDEKLESLDQYEGCSFGYPAENSLYTRERIADAEGIGGFSWIYVYSKYAHPAPFEGRTLIESGDWALHTGQECAKEKEAA